ncbi:histidine phosphotransferase family protein [Devosia algicola]|uniref:Histidine phosphotransferase family protein n=1 Tax=Devosia algicola TaxID=3026418 RepID=A0ABY7YSN6_9HYPH|nr:histidine phosphotransferase family protein [Devosia algicola]WDR04202.1 histidine phosphotransferase family protein [Devosia algicola]
MNLLLIAANSVPRGGQVSASISGDAGAEKFEFTTRSDPEKRQRTLVPSGVAGLLSGEPEEGAVDARGIQPFYTGLLARLTNMALDIGLKDETFFLTAIPAGPDVDVDGGGETERGVE